MALSGQFCSAVAACDSSSPDTSSTSTTQWPTSSGDASLRNSATSYAGLAALRG